MNVTGDTLIWVIVSTLLSVILLFFCIRAYLRSGQRGFLLLTVALVVLPQLSGLMRRPLLDWAQDRGWSAQEYGVLSLAQFSLEMVILAWALILLARPLHRGRRA
ncbi:MAG: hypothetical protein HOH95_14540 [Dehalococcoidia bacterium]|jgi:hypothetical protein|nr:hypothetical protein [Dehalococcoidia bacterium]